MTMRAPISERSCSPSTGNLDERRLWDQNAKPLATFTDVREVQRRLKATGIQFASEADDTTTRRYRHGLFRFDRQLDFPAPLT
jgi:hypothetical protein